MCFVEYCDSRQGRVCVVFNLSSPVTLIALVLSQWESRMASFGGWWMSELDVYFINCMYVCDKWSLGDYQVDVGTT